MTELSLYGSPILSLLAAWSTLAACAGVSRGSSVSAGTATTTPSQPAVTPSRDSAVWLVSDSTSRTATVSLEVTRPAGAASALINGSANGEARIVVPLDWTVKWNWRNADSTAPHSLAVMVQREKIPLEGGRPAFSNAMTRMVTAGLSAGQTDQTTFEAEESGWYWLLCGVPGHALGGEWIELRVDPDSTTASVRVKKR